MNILFIIGNGFDLNCGLKTKYTDAYKEYCKIDSDNELINKFKEMLGDKEQLWSDFEEGLGENADFFKNEEELKICVRDFWIFLKEYLEKIENDFLRNELGIAFRSSMIEEMRKSIKNFYYGCTQNITNEMRERIGKSRAISYNAISFNYTNVFDNLFRPSIDSQYTIGSLITHVHGNIDDDIALGVDRVEDLKASYPLSKSTVRTVVKPVMNEEYDRSRVSESIEKIEMANIICLYGASLGKSDLRWRIKIIEWLQKDVSHQLFVYNKESINLIYRESSSKMEKEEELIEDLLKEWEVNDLSLLEQIHIPLGNRIFNFAKVANDQKKEMAEKGEKIIKAMDKNSKRPVENM